jgi:hypothetical protein
LDEICAVLDPLVELPVRAVMFGTLDLAGLPAPVEGQA